MTQIQKPQKKNTRCSTSLRTKQMQTVPGKRYHVCTHASEQAMCKEQNRAAGGSWRWEVPCQGVPVYPETPYCISTHLVEGWGKDRQTERSQTPLSAQSHSSNNGVNSFTLPLRPGHLSLGSTSSRIKLPTSVWSQHIQALPYHNQGTSQMTKHKTKQNEKDFSSEHRVFLQLMWRACTA